MDVFEPKSNGPYTVTYLVTSPPGIAYDVNDRTPAIEACVESVVSLTFVVVVLGPHL